MRGPHHRRLREGTRQPTTRPERSATGPRTHQHYLHDESAQVAGIEALPFGVLIFVVGSLLIAGSWAVVDAAGAATAAAREGARAYVEAADAASARAEATDAATATMAGHGRSDIDRLTVRVDDSHGGFQRCSEVVVEVSYVVPAVRVPWFGTAASMTVHHTHRELVDPHRSSDAGPGTCTP